MAESRAEALPAHLERAMNILAREAPVHFAAARKRLGDLRAIIRAGTASPIGVCLADGPPWVGPLAKGDVEIGIGDAALSDLLCGQLTVEEGIVSGLLTARGVLDHLLVFLDTLALWLQGALRCASLPMLHEEFLAIDPGTPGTQCSDLEAERAPCP